MADLAGSTGVPLRVTDADRPELVWGQVVTDNFFSALQLDMAAGRGFTPGEDAPVTVLGFRFWQRRFNEDPQIVGKTIAINGHRLTIVGVTARGFTLEREFVRRLQALPGVTSAALASPMPLGPENESFNRQVAPLRSKITGSIV